MIGKEGGGVRTHLGSKTSKGRKDTARVLLGRRNAYNNLPAV